MSTACGNFKPHMWKPGQCAACFRSKAEHGGASVDVPTKSTSTVTAKQTPFYQRLSSKLDKDVSEVKDATHTVQKEDKTSNVTREVTTQQSADETSSGVVESQKPESANVKKLNNQRSDSPAGQSPFVSSGESGTSNSSLVDNMSEQVARPTARARSQTMAAPRVKPRRNTPQPFAQGLDLASSGTTKTLPHGLSISYPVPQPRRSHTLGRSNKSASPAPVDDDKVNETNIMKAKSMDNLDAVPSKRTQPKVTFKSETITIPDPQPSSTAPLEGHTAKKTAAVVPSNVPRSGKKVATVQPYAVSEVTDILEKKALETAKVEEKEDDSDHEYIEADVISAAIVSVNELKTQKTLQRNGAPPHMTKYATLSSVQPSRMNGAPKTGGKQKAASSGALLNRQKTSPQIRRRPPPPPTSKVAKMRSKSMCNEDDREPQDYTMPRRPPPPLYYSNHETKNTSKVTAKPSAVSKVPPVKPARTPSTFQVESPTEVTSDDVFEDENVKDVKSPSADSTLSRPKKPVRMPKEATLPQNTTVQASDEPPLRGKYADLDIDKLEADQALLKLVGDQKPIMKYENFDDFSPPPSRNEQPSVGEDDDDEREYSSIAFDGSGQVHDVIVRTLNIACGELTKLYFEESTFMGTMMCSKWSDLQAAPSDTRNCVRYNGRLFSVQDFDKGRADNEKLISSNLPPHPNICRALAFFTENPPSKLNQKIKIKKGSNHVVSVTDHIPTNSVADFVKEKISSMEPVEYDRHVLLILVQMFSALKHLHSNGTVHRDLSVDTCKYDPKIGTLKVNDFTYALQTPLPLSSSTFLYGYSELKWLGGTGSKLPPEIINTPDDCQILDYSLSDCFAAGCVIYELFNMQVPFDFDEQLIFRNYTKNDLPHIPQRSQYSELIDQLTYLLLQVDTSKRVYPQTALLLTQTILWAPVSWIHGTVTEGEILNFMAVEKARVVSAIAQNSIKGDKKPDIELVLKNIFLQECNPTALLKALPLLKLE